VRLRAPRSGWCTGRYAVTVYLQRGPYCPGPGRPCPLFATREQPTGAARFRVTR
jgi:hypothetical protein